MRLSKLQKYILTRCYEVKNKQEHLHAFYKFYSGQAIKANRKSIQDIIHKSAESLTGSDLVTAFGRQTAKKWFIQKIKLTARGRKKAKEIITSRQLKLLK